MDENSLAAAPIHDVFSPYLEENHLVPSIPRDQQPVSFTRLVGKLLTQEYWDELTMGLRPTSLRIFRNGEPMGSALLWYQCVIQLDGRNRVADLWFNVKAPRRIAGVVFEEFP